MANELGSIQLPRKALVWRTVAAAATASIILFGAVLPAEFGVDPTGLGKLSGLIAFSNKPEALPAGTTPSAPLASVQKSAFRSDILEIPLAADPSPGYELEYKVKMKAGDTLVYSWTTDSPVYYDYHGESFDKPKPRVISYRIEEEAKESHGALTAPYDGIHGWYLMNYDVKPHTVRLKLSGYYEIVMPVTGLAGAQKSSPE